MFGARWVRNSYFLGKPLVAFKCEVIFKIRDKFLVHWFRFKNKKKLILLEQDRKALYFKEKISANFCSNTLLGSVIRGQFYKLYCTLCQSFAPCAIILRHLKLLKSWLTTLLERASCKIVKVNFQRFFLFYYNYCSTL